MATKQKEKHRCCCVVKREKKKSRLLWLSEKSGQIETRENLRCGTGDVREKKKRIGITTKRTVPIRPAYVSRRGEGNGSRGHLNIKNSGMESTELREG